VFSRGQLEKRLLFMSQTPSALQSAHDQRLYLRSYFNKFNQCGGAISFSCDSEQGIIFDAAQAPVAPALNLILRNTKITQMITGTFFGSSDCVHA
jgi:hypothetical protein